MKRPRRSNHLRVIQGGLSILRTIYYTRDELLKLVRGTISPKRERWFAERVAALRSWPKYDPGEMLDSASKVRPVRLMDGKWAWPSSELEIQRRLLKSAPEDAIDPALMRATLEMLIKAGREDAAAKLVELVAESGFLKDKTEPLDNGLPEPKELPAGLLRRIKRLDARLKEMIKDGHYDNDLREIDYSEILHVPMANQQSPAGRTADKAPSDKEWAEILDAFLDLEQAIRSAEKSRR
jgi:hypothetical protein